MWTSLAVLLVLGAAAAQPANSPCRLSQVVTVPNLNEARLAGTWYEVRWYYGNSEQEEYANYAINNTITEYGINVKDFVRYPPEKPCEQFMGYEEMRLKNAVYEYYVDMGEDSRYVRLYIVYTDYDRYMTEFICHKWEEDICLEPEVAFWFRQPLTMQSPVHPFPENPENLIRRNNLCVDPSKYYDIPVFEPPCTPVTHPIGRQEPPPLSRPTKSPDKPIYPEETSCVCPATPYDKELVTLTKSKEEVATRKFVVQKETLELQKQLLTLQMERLRRGLVP